jgi:predicted nucleic acid-binding protein
VILVDTNVLVAAARTADTNHNAAAQLLETIDEPLLVPPTVLTEVC